MNLWQALLHPDQEELEDIERREVGRVANILQVGEFQVLQLAYRAWHGRDLPEALVDRLFHDYMLHNDVPHWARSYARRILRLEESGRLDADQPQYHCYDHSFGGSALSVTGRFWMATGCIVGVIGLVVILLEYSPGRAVSPFPPYFNEQELRQIPPP